MLVSTLPGLCFLLFPKLPLVYYSVPIYRLPEFLVGALCGTAFVRRHWVIPKPLLVLPVACLTFIGWLAVAPLTVTWVSNNVVTVPCIAVIICCIAQTSERLSVRILLANRPMVALGRASYSFYSFQALSNLALLTFLPALQQAFPSLRNQWMLLTFDFIVLCTISLAAYRWIEEPLRRLISGHRPVDRPKRLFRGSKQAN